jgi:transcriptional regulator with XRE-family HTH domain
MNQKSDIVRDVSENSFGQRVTELRKALGYTQTQLAQRAKVSQALVSKIENAETPEEAAPPDTLQKVLAALGPAGSRVLEPMTTPLPEPSALALASRASSPSPHAGSQSFLTVEKSVEAIAAAIGRAFDSNRHDIRDTRVLLSFFEGDPSSSRRSKSPRVGPHDDDELVDACGAMLDAITWLRQWSVEIDASNVLVATALAGAAAVNGRQLPKPDKSEPVGSDDDIPF